MNFEIKVVVDLAVAFAAIAGVIVVLYEINENRKLKNLEVSIMIIKDVLDYRNNTEVREIRRILADLLNKYTVAFDYNYQSKKEAFPPLFCFQISLLKNFFQYDLFKLKFISILSLLFYLRLDCTLL